MPDRAPWIPSESQFADLLVYVFARMSLRNQALILVLYDGALRREEVTFLRRDHIDERTHTITIPHELTKNNMPGRIVLSNTSLQNLARLPEPRSGPPDHSVWSRGCWPAFSFRIQRQCRPADQQMVSDQNLR